MSTAFDDAFRRIKELVADFQANENFYLSPQFSEAAARKDFIDKFFIALGWDVNHDTQKNPYEQEVKIEKNESGSARKADYAFFLGPNFHDVRFFVEAKKPHGEFGSPDNYFQTLRYGWNGKTPLVVLANFEELHILDSRFKPHISDTLSRVVKRFTYADYADAEKFAEIYWLFSREAVANNSLAKFAETLPKPKSKTFRRELFKGGYQSLDESFLIELDNYREMLARAFKSKNPQLNSEQLTEITQRTIDRLVFIRFLEDKQIESVRHVERFGENTGSAWTDFVETSIKLDRIYNGVVFKRHEILDAPGFQLDEKPFRLICEELADPTSPYNFDSIPIHILGSIYERFLGKIITDGARVEEKPEVRKADGVYYTPEYIVRYIVAHTVGKAIENKSPAEITGMKFADIACGSGSFLLEVFDLLIRHHTKFYNAHPGKAKKGDCAPRDDGLHLSLKKKQEILRNNLFGVDIDRQAVEVAQLSLYLKLLEDETIGTTHAFQNEFHYTLLPPLTDNIVCGNSLIAPDILDEEWRRRPVAEGSATKASQPPFTPEEEKKLNPLDFAQRFPQIFKIKASGGELRETAPGELEHNVPGGMPLHGNYPKVSYRKSKKEKSIALPETEYEGGFDAIVGNPPWGVEFNARELKYLRAHYKSAEASNIDSYPLFAEAAVKHLKKNGLLGYIIPDTFLRKDDYLPTREFLFHRTTIRELIETGPVFSQVRDTWCLVLTAQNGKLPKSKIRHRKLSRFIVSAEDRLKKFSSESWDAESEVPQSLWNERPNLIVGYLADTAAQKLIAKIENNPRLGELKNRFLISRGEEGSKFNLVQKANGNFFMVTPENVERYEVAEGLRIDNKTLAANKVQSFYRHPKIWIVRIQKMRWKQRIVAGLDKRCDSAGMKTLQVIISATDDLNELKFLQALLVSKLMNFWCVNYLADDMNQSYLEKLPIKEIGAADKARHDKLVSLVEKMLEARQQLSAAKTDGDKDFYTHKCATLDRQIDTLVYDLYALTEAEIKIVEGAV